MTVVDSLRTPNHEVPPRTACRCHAHPNIVQLKEVFLTTHYLAIVMEYMKGSNMPTYLAKHAPLPEPVARWVIVVYQALSVRLSALHIEVVPTA